MPLTIGRALRRVRAGTAHSTWRAPAFAAPETISVSSPDFADGHPIPQPHAAKGIGANLSPGLEWTTPPAGTAQLLLVIEDSDVPLPRPVVHTAAVLPAELRTLAHGELRPGNPAVNLLQASLGRPGYHGPPPSLATDPTTTSSPCTPWTSPCLPRFAR